MVGILKAKIYKDKTRRQTKKNVKREEVIKSRGVYDENQREYDENREDDNENEDRYGIQS